MIDLIYTYIQEPKAKIHIYIYISILLGWHFTEQLTAQRKRSHTLVSHAPERKGVKWKARLVLTQQRTGANRLCVYMCTCRCLWLLAVTTIYSHARFGCIHSLGCYMLLCIASNWLRINIKNTLSSQRVCSTAIIATSQNRSHAELISCRNIFSLTRSSSRDVLVASLKRFTTELLLGGIVTK